jgi:hypothetical protein
MRIFAIPLIAGSLSLSLASQAPITSTPRPHLDAAICADGSHVAFRVGAQALGVVDTMTAVESTLHTSAASGITSFVWSTNNTDVFFADGNTIQRVNVNGGAASVVASPIAGGNVRVFCFDAAANLLFGTRTDPAVNRTWIFRVSTTGAPMPTDIHFENGTIDEVRLDDSGQYLLFRTWTGAQPVPSTFRRYDLVANTVVTMTTFNDLAESPQWAIAPIFFVVAVRSPTHAVQQVALVTIGNVDFLTDDTAPHRRLYGAPGSELVAHETTSPTGGGTTIGFVPNHGGGVVMLHAGQPLWLNGGASTGGLSFDDGETMVAFSAAASATDPNPQVWLEHIHEEIHVHPKVLAGAQFTMELHVDLNEIGAVAVADGLAAAPLSVPGIGGDFWLAVGPGRLQTVLSGIGNGMTPLAATWSVPPSPLLVGLRLWFQGVRFDATFAGEFTRFGYFEIF